MLDKFGILSIPLNQGLLGVLACFLKLLIIHDWHHIVEVVSREGHYLLHELVQIWVALPQTFPLEVGAPVPASEERDQARHDEAINRGPRIKSFPRYAEGKELGWEDARRLLLHRGQSDALDVVVDTVSKGLKADFGFLKYSIHFLLPGLPTDPLKVDIPHELVNYEGFLTKLFGQ